MLRRDGLDGRPRRFRDLVVERFRVIEVVAIFLELGKSGLGRGCVFDAAQRVREFAIHSRQALRETADIGHARERWLSRRHVALRLEEEVPDCDGCKQQKEKRQKEIRSSPRSSRCGACGGSRRMPGRRTDGSQARNVVERQAAWQSARNVRFLLCEETGKAGGRWGRTSEV